MTHRPKVLIRNSTVPKIAFDILKEKCDLICCEDDRKEILEKIKGVDALFWTARCNIDAELLDAAGTQMKIVGAMSSGLNHIDLPELKKRGIKLGSTSAISEAVADVAILLALAASRRLTEGRWQIERGTWTENKDLQWMLGLDITGSTIGIIGLGSIGQAIVKRSKGFQIGKVLYTGHREKPEGRELNAEFVDLDTLTKESDFIFVSAPLTKETVLMCNEDFFSKMKNTGIFINVSRDDLVDHTALVKALKENRIFAAGLDAMTPEPLPTDHELLKLPNVVVLPHIGSATVKTRNDMAELTANNILRALAGEDMLTPVKL